MLKSLLLIFAVCTQPSECLDSTTQVTIMEYDRLVECVRAKAEVDPAYDTICTGKPFDPRQQTLG